MQLHKQVCLSAGGGRAVGGVARVSRGRAGKRAGGRAARTAAVMGTPGACTSPSCAPPRRQRWPNGSQPQSEGRPAPPIFPARVAVRARASGGAHGCLPSGEPAAVQQAPAGPCARRARSRNAPLRGLTGTAAAAWAPGPPSERPPTGPPATTGGAGALQTRRRPCWTPATGSRAPPSRAAPCRPQGALAPRARGGRLKRAEGPGRGDTGAQTPKRGGRRALWEWVGDAAQGNSRFLCLNLWRSASSPPPHARPANVSEHGERTRYRYADARRLRAIAVRELARACADPLRWIARRASAPPSRRRAPSRW